jgi:murein DD-endopeptidase MepM/ murein hydrolase activator NlpD
MFQLLFPQYKNRGWVYLPLGSLALAEQRPNVPNPLLDTSYCQRWVRRLQRRYGARCSFGGWFEDRSTLWRGHYMPPGSAYHLGVDFSVPERSRVYSPTEGTVIETWHDVDRVGGWGGRIVIQIKQRLFLILAHFGKIHVHSGKNVTVGHLLGTVGGANENGNWFPHLHAQVVRGKFDNQIDGYGEFSVRNQRRFPDPFTLWPAVLRVSSE